jgi:hypothetical protein
MTKGVFMVGKVLARLGVLVLLVVAASACNMVGSGPAETVKKFQKAVETGQLDEAVKQLSPSLLQMFPPQKVKAMLGEETQKIKKKKGVSSFEVTKEEVTGEVADVRYVVKYGDGTTRSEDTHLTKENGQWKISPNK